MSRSKSSSAASSASSREARTSCSSAGSFAATSKACWSNVVIEHLLTRHCILQAHARKGFLPFGCLEAERAERGRKLFLSENNLRPLFRFCVPFSDCPLLSNGVTES